MEGADAVESASGLGGMTRSSRSPGGALCALAGSGRDVTAKTTSIELAPSAASAKVANWNAVEPFEVVPGAPVVVVMAV